MVTLPCRAQRARRDVDGLLCVYKCGVRAYHAQAVQLGAVVGLVALSDCASGNAEVVAVRIDIQITGASCEEAWPDRVADR